MRRWPWVVLLIWLTVVAAAAAVLRAELARETYHLARMRAHLLRLRRQLRCERSRLYFLTGPERVRQLIDQWQLPLLRYDPYHRQIFPSLAEESPNPRTQ